MSLWKIAWRSIQQRALASGLTGLSMALGVALVVAVLVMQGLINASFLGPNGFGYNRIVGAKGSKVQLVLNTVYYLSSPVENLPYSYYKEFTQGKYKRYTALAVPVCLGDVYEDFRVVGTTPDMFDKFDYDDGKKYAFSSGKNFTADGFFDAVIGARVARETGLKVGSEFQPTHGVGGHKHDDGFHVVGVLDETGTPVDRALFVNIEGFYLLENHALPDKPLLPEHSDEHAHEHKADEHAHDHKHEHADEHEPAANVAGAKPHEHAEGAEHEHEHAHEHEHEHDHHAHEHHPLPESQREVTAILLLTAGQPDLTASFIAKDINKGTIGQIVSPVYEIASLFEIFVRPSEYMLLALTVMIVIVSGIAILVSIYNSMSERRREIAVMRALGAGRGTVMRIVLLESILLSLGGGLIGWALGHLLVAGVSPWLNATAGVQIGLFRCAAEELVIIPGLIVLAAIAGYLPALVAYRTDVSQTLSATP